MKATPILYDPDEWKEYRALAQRLKAAQRDTERLDALEALPGISLRYNPEDVAMPLPLSLRSQIDAFLARLDAESK
jgi:hypothetical protein